ncbi:MAG: asparagine synthase (glutamine-hydrolyzing) [Bacteroidota bacterium]|nr:asparagine synthase (glutamine-hydrolyzing) [Bacteroidota bacterium]
MCGIAGIINCEGVDATFLKVMSDTLQHRGPDDEGFAISGKAVSTNYYKGNNSISEVSFLPNVLQHEKTVSNTIGLLHKRLSILDLSPAGHQPMTYQNKYTIVFNGEIYNYKELKNELLQKGFQFVSDTDTEVILAAYSYWGQNCVSYFIGMWAFAIYDKERNELFISRDRFGIKPLYFFQSKTLFVFASEIKALLQIDAIKPEANITSVFEYISFGATADPSANLFKHIQVIAPAHNLVVNTETLQTTITSYYNLKENVFNYKLPDAKEIQNTFNHCLNNSIDLQLRADVSIGSTLSGGLDSSTIVALAASKLKGTTFKTFTAAYHEKEIDESDFAKKVVADYKNINPFFTYPNSKTFWQDIDKLIWHQDLPINSTSMFAQWEVMKLANQQNIKVLLDGQGADEILGGYYNFAGIYLIEKIKHLQLASFISEKNELQKKFSPNINNTLGRAFYYFTPDFMQRSIRSKKRLGMNSISQNFHDKLENIDVPARGGKTFKEQSLLSVQFSLQDLLRYEDRNSMAFSIESRVPFLDHRLVEFSVALHNDWKIKNGWTKYILRKSAEPILPKEVVWRKYKMGFLTPQKIWKDESKQELTQFINDISLPNFLSKDYLLKLNNSEINNSSHLSEFWKLISFLKWAEIFKVTF